MKYTLRHLQIFLAVARHQSISRASAELSMSQSAVSAALQEFEARYDMQLFDRGGKRLKLNHYGDSVRSHAEALMVQAQTFDQFLLGREEPGDLRVGASLTIGNYVAVKHLAVYMQRHPDAVVEMTVGSTPEVVEKVQNFELDIGLIEAELHNEQLDFHVWCDDRMVVFCRPDHPLAGKANLNDRDLLSLSWILRESSSGHRQTFDRSMQGLLPELNIVLELTHNEAIKNAVKAGLGVGCLSEMAIEEELQSGTLKILPLKKRPMHRKFYFVTHRQVAMSQATQEWIQMCVS